MLNTPPPPTTKPTHGRGSARQSPSRSTALDKDYALISEGLFRDAWEALGAGRIRWVDFRILLAVVELITQWRASGQKRKVRLDDDLHRLTRARRPRASLRRLEAAGLLEDAQDRLRLPKPRGARRRFPRQVVRWLAADGTRATVGLVWFALFRCTRTKSSSTDRSDSSPAFNWVNGGWLRLQDAADYLGMSIRQIKAARSQLVGIGWLVPGDRARRNGLGSWYEIDPDWRSGIAPSRAPVSHLSEAPDAPESHPPDDAHYKDRVRVLTGISSREEKQDRDQTDSTRIYPKTDLVESVCEPGAPSPREEPRTTREPAPRSASQQSDADLRQAGRPSLDHIDQDDLLSEEGVFDLYRQAVDRGLITASEEMWELVVQAVVHGFMCESVHSPECLVAAVLRGKCRHVYLDRDYELDFFEGLMSGEESWEALGGYIITYDEVPGLDDDDVELVADRLYEECAELLSDRQGYLYDRRDDTIKTRKAIQHAILTLGVEEVQSRLHRAFSFGDPSVISNYLDGIETWTVALLFSPGILGYLITAPAWNTASAPIEDLIAAFALEGETKESTQ